MYQVLLLLTAVSVATLVLSFATVKLDEKEFIGDIFTESRSLSLFGNHRRETKTNNNKCFREVPAIFFQVMKNEPVRGNGTTIFFNRIETCCDGYVPSVYDRQHCVPDCSGTSSNNCRNGFCRAPNRCECFEEFVANDHGECVHTCPIACQHGRCYLNGTCICDRGYFLDPQTHKFCRPECRPVCGKNQECISPGKCTCREGYKDVNDLGCQPICTPDCGHGKCVGPNECECFVGYTKRSGRNVCEAECNINCENGFCESRYRCQCRDGYRYDEDTTSCLPDCGDECQNGVCIAPGVCRCFAGYEQQGAGCRPKCEGGCGYYGKCLDTNVCGCGATHQLCNLGTCTASGKCNCAAGLTRFIDTCVPPILIESLMGSEEQRLVYNNHLVLEFEALVGIFFTF